MKEAKNKNALRSVRMLEESYIQLLSEKDPDKISVSDISRRADLNRGTFYAHYDDIHDLERSLTDKLVKHLTEVLTEVLDSTFVLNPRPILDRIGSYLTENGELIHRLVSTGKLLPVFASLEERVRDEVIMRLNRRYPDQMPFLLVLSDYVVGGMLRSYQSWIGGGDAGASITEVNDALEELIKSTGALMAERSGQGPRPAAAPGRGDDRAEGR